LAIAADEMDRLLSRFIAHFKNLPTEVLPPSTGYGDVHQLELIHSSLVDFVGDATDNRELPPYKESPSGRSLSMAIFCLRYLCLPQFATASMKEFRLEKRRISNRDQRHPFYRFAAISWVRLSRDHWGDEHLREAARQLFDPACSVVLQQWVVECARTWFPRDIGFQALSSIPFMDLISIFSDGHDLRLPVAASMSLHHICTDLIEQGADVNHISPLGTPIRCALVGPAALIGPWLRMNIVLEHLQLELANETRSDQLATLSVLLDKSASCQQNSMPKGAHMSTHSLALVVCSRLRAAEMFFRILGDDVKFDYQFLFFFDRGPFRDVLISTNPTADEARTYLNALFEGLAKMTIPSFDRVGEDSAVEVYEAVWTFTLANELDWCDKIRQYRLPFVSDEQFSEFLENGAMESPYAIRLVSKDPRFNPNAVSRSGRPLLHKAKRQSLPMVKLFVEAGADLSTRDSRGMTLAHLCARDCKIDILQYLVEKGADTTLTTTETSDDSKPVSGKNVSFQRVRRGLTASTLVHEVKHNSEDIPTTDHLHTRFGIMQEIQGRYR
jgi:hypothetical protein